MLRGLKQTIHIYPRLDEITHVPHIIPPCGGDQPPVTRPGPDTAPAPATGVWADTAGAGPMGARGWRHERGEREIFPGQQRGDMGDMSDTGVTWALEILQSQQPYRVN